LEKAPGATLVAEYIDRIVKDLDEGEYDHVISQLDIDIWKDTLAGLGVPDAVARATLDVLEVLHAGFDPDDPSGHPAVRETLKDLRQSWSD
jgi:hypothetical protein